MTTAVVRTTGGLWRSCHPGPSVVVTALAATLSIAAGLELWRIALLTVAVFAGQLWIGLSNDALDAERDREVGRTDKPIAQGEVSTRTAWIAASACLLLALASSAPLGLGLVIGHAVFLASAWSYNAVLKASAASILPFILSFGLFPSLATLASAAPQLAPSWAWAAGGAFGAAVHLTNVLPDLEDDSRTGIRGLPHRLGALPSVLLAAAALVLGALAVLTGPVLTGPSATDASVIPAVSWLFFGPIVIVALLTVGLAFAGRSSRLLFRLVMLAALLLAAQLVASGNAFI